MKILIGWIAQVVGHNGGMDKVFVNFANEMTRRGHEVTLAYCTELSGRFYTPIMKEVKIINIIDLITNHKFESVKKSIPFKIRREIFRIIHPASMKEMETKFTLHRIGNAVFKLLQQEKPDIIITLDHGTTAVFQKVNDNQKFPVIAMSHFDAGSILKWASKIELEALSQCDVIQVLMPSDRELFCTKMPRNRVVYIPNSVPPYNLEPNTSRRPVIIDVARFDIKQKRQHLLIHAFAKIAEQFPNWRLEFWGEEQNSIKYTTVLQRLIRENHLEKQVKLCGNAENVLSVYQHASVFAFPSAYEGFPLAMTEAMSAGLPVVAYRSCPAVNELVKDGESGLLVDDGVDALAEGLKKLMENQKLREHMGGAAHEAMQAFAPEKIWDQWEILMKEVVANHQRNFN